MHTPLLMRSHLQQLTLACAAWSPQQVPDEQRLASQSPCESMLCVIVTLQTPDVHTELSWNQSHQLTCDKQCWLAQHRCGRKAVVDGCRQAAVLRHRILEVQFHNGAASGVQVGVLSGGHSLRWLRLGMSHITAV